MNPPENTIQQSAFIPSLGSLFQLGPEWVLLFALIMLAVLSPIAGTKKPAILFWTASAAIVLSSIWNIANIMSGSENQLGSMLVNDVIGGFFKALFAGTSLFTLFLYWFSDRKKTTLPEFFPMWIALLFGLNLMAMSRHLLMMVISLEVVSLSAYVLTGMGRKAAAGSEAALKYFLYGSFVTAVSIYGISWVYGFTGTLDPDSELFARGLMNVPAEGLVLVFVFLFAAFAFKISAAPFHFWAPDVYSAVHWPVAAFFSVAPKAAGFIMLMRLVHPLQTHPELRNVIFALLAILFGASLLLGNLSALRQNNLRRLLAFSGVAQSGFILLGVMSFQNDGFAAATFYLMVYSFMNLGLFCFVGWMEEKSGTSDLVAAGAFMPSSPWVLFSLVVFSAGLIGLPGTAGFTGKLSLFTSFLASRNQDSISWILVSFALLNILPALFYYLNVPAKWLFRRETAMHKIEFPPFAPVILSVLAFLVIWLGILHFGKFLWLFGILFEKIA